MSFLFSMNLGAQIFFPRASNELVPASGMGIADSEMSIGRLQEDLDRVFPSKFKLPNDYIHDKLGRVVKGGIYSWQPADGLRPSHPSMTAMYGSDDGFQATQTHSYKSVPQVLINSSPMVEPMAFSPPMTPMTPMTPMNKRHRFYDLTKRKFDIPRAFATFVVLAGTAVSKIRSTTTLCTQNTGSRLSKGTTMGILNTFTISEGLFKPGSHWH